MNTVTVSKPKITLAMIMCGILSAACVGAASAAMPDDDTLSTVVKYDPQAISTQAGAQMLYQKLVKAAREVCPADSSSPYILSGAVIECRQQSLARAVFKINNPRLVAVYNTSTKRG
jgi:UrcA family protein